MGTQIIADNNISAKIRRRITLRIIKALLLQNAHSYNASYKPYVTKYIVRMYDNGILKRVFEKMLEN